MEEFLIAFMVPLEAMYRQAIKWKGYATIIDFQSSLEPSRADEQPAERYGSGPRGPAPIPTRPAPRLHNLEAHAAGTPAYDGQASPYQPAGWEEFPDHDDDAAHEAGDEESSYKTPHDERAGDPDEGEDSCLPANHREAYLNLIDERNGASAPVDAKTLPCFEKLNKGKCEKPQCPYSHENRVLEGGGEVGREVGPRFGAVGETYKERRGCAEQGVSSEAEDGVYYVLVPVRLCQSLGLCA
jgi:hypothetical protein